jgi:hypothetical protein
MLVSFTANQKIPYSTIKMKTLLISTRLSAIILCTVLLLTSRCNSSTNKTEITTANKPTVPDFLSEKQFDALFPLRDKFYSYGAFIKAVKELGVIKVQVARRAASARIKAPENQP